MNGVFIGIGSNIDSKENIKRIIVELCNLFSEIHISEVVITHPLNINSKHPFLNAVIFVNTDLNVSFLENSFKNIEEKLGRKINLKNRKLIDRTADIDLLTTNKDFNISNISYSIPNEPYFKDLYLSLSNYLGFININTRIENLRTVEIQINNKLFGKSPTTINCNL